MFGNICSQPDKKVRKLLFFRSTFFLVRITRHSARDTGNQTDLEKCDLVNTFARKKTASCRSPTLLSWTPESVGLTFSTIFKALSMDGVLLACECFGISGSWGYAKLKQSRIENCLTPWISYAQVSAYPQWQGYTVEMHTQRRRNIAALKPPMSMTMRWSWSGDPEFSIYEAHVIKIDPEVQRRHDAKTTQVLLSENTELIRTHKKKTKQCGSSAFWLLEGN